MTSNAFTIKPPAVATFGLTHIALKVRNVRRAFDFYQAVFGMIAVYDSDDFLQAQTPGTRDVMVFERSSDNCGNSEGIAHFGFRLVSPHDIDAAASAVRLAGGIVTEQGEFVPGEPYLYARDLDGYAIEVWYEIPTPVDPRPPLQA